jgi:hypothetical protein
MTRSWSVISWMTRITVKMATAVTTRADQSTAGGSGTGRWM